MKCFHVTKSLLIRPEVEAASRLTTRNVTSLIGFQMTGNMLTRNPNTLKHTFANVTLDHVIKMNEHVIPQLGHLFGLTAAEWAPVTTEHRILRSVPNALLVTRLMHCMIRWISER